MWNLMRSALWHNNWWDFIQEPVCGVNKQFSWDLAWSKMFNLISFIMTLQQLCIKTPDLLVHNCKFKKYPVLFHSISLLNWCKLKVKVLTFGLSFTYFRVLGKTLTEIFCPHFTCYTSSICKKSVWQLKFISNWLKHNVLFLLCFGVPLSKCQKWEEKSIQNVEECIFEHWNLESCK